MPATTSMIREVTLKHFRPLLGVCAALICVGTALMGAGPARAASVSSVQVRIVTGREELPAGSVLELRIYESGRSPRHLALTHGESLPRDSTLVIPVKLSEPLDPRSVSRFGIYCRTANVADPAWEVLAADVDLAAGRGPPDHLLNATVSGVVTGQGELATDERNAGSMTCVVDADCDDHHKCNGRERCAPGAAGADNRGCVKGSPLVCPVNQVCTEEHGCRGLEGAAPAASGSTPPK
jgi:hypothetical protein